MDSSSDQPCMCTHLPLEHDLGQAKLQVVCFRCGNTAQQGQKYSLCGQCGCARYCSKDCQLADWPVHKSFCKGYKLRSCQPTWVYSHTPS